MEIRGLNLVKVNGSGPVDPEEPLSNILKFAINFSSDPSTVFLTRPKHKYNKLAYFNVHWDDGALRQGNPVIGYLRSLFYTDGCGNNKPYTTGIAINTGTGLPGDEYYNSQFLQAAELRYFIDANDEGPMNHGNVHGPDPTAIVDVNKLDARILQRVEYQMRSVVVPSAFDGYAHAASLADYKFCTSQGDHFDEFNPPTRWYRLMTEPILSTMHQKGVVACVVREFNDEWASTSTWWHDYIRGQMDNLFTPSSDFLIIGTHNPLTNTSDLNGFKSDMDYFKNIANDRCLVCSPREWVEYLEMRMLPMTQEIVGNQIIVTINATNLSEKNRWRDLSFLASGNQTITGVEIIEGIDSTSYNPASRLINIFKQKKIWN